MTGAEVVAARTAGLAAVADVLAAFGRAGMSPAARVLALRALAGGAEAEAEARLADADVRRVLAEAWADTWVGGEVPTPERVGAARLAAGPVVPWDVA